MNLEANQLIKLLKILFGLSESGNYWGGTFWKHLGNVFDIKSCRSDAASVFKTLEQKLVSLCAFFVEDTLYVGNPK